MPRTYTRRQGERVPREYGRAKIYVPIWVDPYIWVQGSSIEKKVMAELVRRGIYFQHTVQENPLPWPKFLIDENKDPRKWEPDFLFPQYKIWLEIQGSHWHTLPGAVEADALRFAYIEHVGWKPIAWWEEDIEMRLQDLFNEVPEFYMVNRDLEARTYAHYKRTPGLPFYEGGEGIDHLAGLRAALRGRARPPQNMVKRYQRLRRPK